MKKYFILFFAIIASVFFYAYKSNYFNTEENFSWSSKKLDEVYNSENKVVFLNGAELFLKKNPEMVFGDQLFLKTPDTSPEIYIEDDHVTIHDAYPNISKANVAIISHQCGGSGSMCGSRYTYLVEIKKNSVDKFFISDEPFGIKISLNEGQLKSAIANVVLGEDSYGSKVRGNVEFVLDQGFVHPEMKPYYRDLLGKYPWDYFDHKVAREPLAKSTSIEKFRDLRTHIQFASNNKLENYRYLIIEGGCKPHVCDSESGTEATILIDTVSDNLWWIERHKGKTSYGSHGNFSHEDVKKYNKVFENIEWASEFQPMINKNGKFTAKYQN